MGHLVNPIAWRLGKNIYWKSLYYINSLDFAYNNVNDMNLFIFLNKFFRNRFLKFSNVLMTNFKILKFFSGTFVYALFKSHVYTSGGITKYYKNFFLKKLFKKKSLKKKKTTYTKNFNKAKIRLKLKRSSKSKKKSNFFVDYFTEKKVDIIDFYDYRVETFKKIAKKKGRFISRKYNFYKIRYLKRKCFLNYSSYINNFKKNFGSTHRREIEYHIVSKTMRKLKSFFLSKFSRKISRENRIFNNYFHNNPLGYYKKKSLFSGSKSSILRYFAQNKNNPFIYGRKNDYSIYDFKNFFIFNILKLFPKFFLDFSNKYTMPNNNYIFIKNKLNFKISFYNNFLHMYRKFPILLFVKNFLSTFVNKFFNRVKFTFIFCSEKFISANLIRNFILAKMSHRFKIERIVFSILRLLNSFCRRNIIRGFRVLLAGRFSRKDRATFHWKKNGFLSFNNKMSALEYSFGTRVLRYSLCACKVWINN